MALDELDGKLIAMLQDDGRASNIELAKRIGVSEGTVRRRFRNLVEDKVIRVVAIPDPAKMGRSTTALIGLQALAEIILAIGNFRNPPDKPTVTEEAPAIAEPEPEIGNTTIQAGTA